MDISARAVSLADRPQAGPFGSPGFAGAGKTGPPSRFILSQTLAGNGTMSLLSPDQCQFLCSCREAVPSSRPAGCAGHRAQGPSRLAVAVGFVLAPAFAGHALTVPSTVPRLRRLGRRRSCPGDLEVALLVEHRPGDTGQLVGKCDRQHVVMQPLLGGFDPRLEPVALP